MSHRNGNRSRFDSQRKAKMHNRTRIRELRKAMKSENRPEAKAESKQATTL
jgi:hypothetical protein